MAYDYARWMEGNVDRKCPLGHIVLPGTHNSGSYNEHNTIMVRCQDRNIRQQLLGGVRVFDIRVRVENNWYVMHHGDHCPPTGTPEERQQYEFALEQMKNFLTTYPKEIIIIALRGSEHGNLNEEQKRYVLWKVWDVFKDLLFVGELKGDITYGQLLDSGKRVILIAKDGFNSLPGWPCPDWARSDACFRNTWYEAQSQFGGLTDQERLDLVKKNTVESVTWRASKQIETLPAWNTVGTPLLCCDFNIWTTNICELAKNQVNPMAARLVHEWTADITNKWGCNIMSVDFFNLPNTDLIDAVIQANQIKMQLFHKTRVQQ